jgi:predicted ribosome quality control (RQC) complex YloA/Tae2 family protein
MTLSNAEIDAVIADVGHRLEGGTIERIDQPGSDRLVLNVRNGAERYWLMVCSHPRFSRIHLLTRRPDEGPPAGGFCKMVRQHLTASPVLAVRKVDRDRVVVIESQERDQLMKPHPVSLVAELMGPHSRLMLLDEQQHVIASQGPRPPAPGTVYELPEPPAELPPQALENRFDGVADPDDPLALSRAIQVEYAQREAEEELLERKSTVRDVLTTGIGRVRRRMKKQRQELEVAEDAEAIRKRGELLKIALPRLKKGQDRVTVEDLFDPDRPELTIELDPTLGPAENVSAVFERYKKAKAGCERLGELVQEAERELEELEFLLEELEECTTPDEVAKVRKEVKKAGLRFPGEKTARRKRVSKSGPRRFESADGFEILVARSSRQNEKLTFTIANGNDTWLHLLGWPGPHVVVRKPADREVTGQAVIDAAHLAVHFSKIRGADRADVTKTQVKYVRKLKGGPPGRVSYANADTIHVRMERKRLRRLLETMETAGA